MIPDRLHSVTIREALANARYEAGLRRDVLKMLQDLSAELLKELSGAGLHTPRTDWQRARLRDLLEVANRRISEVYGEVETVHSEGMAGLVEVSSDRIVAGYNKAIGADLLQTLDWSEAQLAKLSDNTLINGAPSAEWWGRQAEDLRRAFADQVRVGMLRGESLGQMLARVKNLDGIGRANAENLVRTSAVSVANAAHMAAFEANSDIMGGVEWTATLDQRTCLACASMDQKTWEMGESHPVPALHFRCRCALVGVTKTWEQLAREAGGDTRLARELDQIDPGDRASMGGPVSGKYNFESWLKALPEADQRDILGDRKWEIWNRSGLTLSQMVDGTGRELSLKELRALR